MFHKQREDWIAIMPEALAVVGNWLGKACSDDPSRRFTAQVPSEKQTKVFADLMQKKIILKFQT